MNDHDTMSAFEQHLLLAIMRLAPNAYGLSIREELKQRTNREHSAGTIYAGLERLESKGWIESKESEAIAKRGGRRKLMFSINGNGQSALRDALQGLDNLRYGLAGVLV